MIKKVKLAKINLTMQSGRIVRWLKKEGEWVERDEPLLEVETDKAVNTVVSFHSGYLKKILVAEDQEIPVDSLIAYIGDADDEVPVERLPDDASVESAGTVGTAQAAATSSPDRGGSSAPSAGASAAGDRALTASPLARRLAAELGVDLTAVTGSGPDGRIGKEDVLAASRRRTGGASGVSTEGEGFDATQQVRLVPLSGLKKTTAERMTASYREAPHIHLDISIDVDPLEALRARLNADTGAAGAEAGDGHYTITDLIVRAVSLALRSLPLLNASFGDRGIEVYREQGIGVAVSTPGGLVVPVIRSCQSLDLAGIRDRRRELIRRAREGRQKPEDLASGTFTVTNLGMFGVDCFRPILYPGQAAILAVGAVRRIAVPEASGGFSARSIVQLTLGCDHRVVDGAEAAAFLQRLKELLESPSALLSDAETATEAPAGQMPKPDREER